MTDSHIIAAKVSGSHPARNGNLAGDITLTKRLINSVVIIRLNAAPVVVAVQEQYVTGGLQPAAVRLKILI